MNKSSALTMFIISSNRTHVYGRKEYNSATVTINRTLHCYKLIYKLVHKCHLQHINKSKYTTISIKKNH